jgi:hypothetical protein
MAESTVSPGGAPLEPSRKTLFEPFKWYEVDSSREMMMSGLSHLADFAGTVRDVAAGCKAALQVIERDDIDDGCSDENGDPWPALLDVNTASCLNRLCIASLSMLVQEAERVGESIVKRATAAGGAA